METFSVRCVIKWFSREGQEKKYVYEERLTLWKAKSFEIAIELAEKEAKDYAENLGEVLDYSAAFRLFDDIDGFQQGAEIYSLLRESDLEPSNYIDTFFDTGHEKQDKTE